MLGHCRNHHRLSVEFAKPFYATKLKEAWVILKSKSSQYFFMFKKNPPQNLLITGDLSEVDDLLSAYTLQLPVWLIHESLCGKLWKKSKENILYFKNWVELILFRITSLNILFVSDFFLFFFRVHVSFFQLADNYHIILVCYLTKN